MGLLIFLSAILIASILFAVASTVAMHLYFDKPQGECFFLLMCFFTILAFVIGLALYEQLKRM
jgi:Na+/melibiose symporter-like transporter